MPRNFLIQFRISKFWEDKFGSFAEAGLDRKRVGEVKKGGWSLENILEGSGTLNQSDGAGGEVERLGSHIKM